MLIKTYIIAVVNEAEFRLTDELFDVGKIVSAPNGKSLSTVYEQLLEGENSTQAYVFTGFDFDSSRKTVSWTMDAKKLMSAHAAGWNLVLFRLDSTRLGQQNCSLKLFEERWLN